eukprot:7803433-Pyramimonas_sp.AAC.1
MKQKRIRAERLSLDEFLRAGVFHAGQARVNKCDPMLGGVWGWKFWSGEHATASILGKLRSWAHLYHKSLSWCPLR